MFTVAPNKIEVKPIEEVSALEDDRKHYIEAGEVIQVGNLVMDTKIGDILFFQDYSCVQTAKDREGKRHWVVLADETVILGKDEL